MKTDEPMPKREWDMFLDGRLVDDLDTVADVTGTSRRNAAHDVVNMSRRTNMPKRLLQEAHAALAE